MNRTPLSRRLRFAGAAWIAALALGACGGGVESEPFVPTRMIVFGDETSVLDDSASPGNARKHTVNALRADKVTLDCAGHLLWTQSLAASYGLVLPQCVAAATVTTTSRVYAAPGALVSGIAAQVSTHLAGGTGFGAHDLVTLLGGTNDVIAEYLKYPGVSAAQLELNVEAAGAALARQAIRISDEGGRVLVSTMPDLGTAPFAKAQVLATGDPGRAQLLSRLSDRFNAQMRVTLPPDGGRTIGLLLYNEVVRAFVRSPSGFSNVTDPACDVAKAPLVQNCTTETLVSTDAAALYVWADDRWPSPAMHNQLASLAIGQARRNPF